MKIISLIKKLYAKPYVATPGALPPSWAPYKDYIDIHPTALIAPSATVQFYNLPSTPRKMLRIGEMSHIFGNFAFVREDANISIGKRCQIGNSHFIASKNISVGDDVLMAWGCTVIDTDTHATEWPLRQNDATACYNDYIKNPANILATKDWKNVARSSVTIGDKSWIGFNVIILKGVILGAQTIAGAGAVITKSFQEGGTVVGSPARKVK